jgi:hypothetical protein
MADKNTKTEADRRSFLKFAGLGSIASGVTLLSAEQAQANEAADGGARSGYAETDHVKAFYRSARF